jgi:hypothetical protein
VRGAKKKAMQRQAFESDADELFEMANLFQRTTGLPITVWVSPRGNARHDVRVKVNMTHGDHMNIANTAVVGVRPHVIAGHLLPDDQRAVFDWISLNAAAIVEYWDGRIDTIELGKLLKAASVAPAPFVQVRQRNLPDPENRRRLNPAGHSSGIPALRKPSK